MKNRRLWVSLSITAIVSLLAYGAVAQDAKGASPKGKKGVSGLVFSSVDKARIAKMSNQEMLQEAQKSIAQMKSSREKTDKLLSKARDAKPANFKKVNCINKQILSINGHIKISTNNYTLLKDATKRTKKKKRGSGPAHYMEMISASSTTVEQKSQKARLCLNDPQDFGEGGNSALNVADDIPSGYNPIQGSGSTESEVAANESEGSQSTNPEQIMELTPFGG